MNAAASSHDTKSLIGLIDRLEALLNASELSEIEIEAGETALVLRKATAIVAPAAPIESAAAATPAGGAAVSAASSQPQQQTALNAVVAPLTGLFYGAPSPGADPYVKVGNQVMVGQVIGLIEAMKLFNEIKSDRAGRVTRVFQEDGALVKAKEPLIEVEP
ncbi:MAG: biotin/lipoyl-containing protein [Chloroflexota bacterium]